MGIRPFRRSEDLFIEDITDADIKTQIFINIVIEVRPHQ